MGNDPFVDLPAGCWLLALGIHATPPTLLANPPIWLTMGRKGWDDEEGERAAGE